MSKKSRKRNKKILAMLALAGGAALMGRKKAGEMSGNVTIPDSQKEGFTSNYITKKTAPVDNVVDAAPIKVNLGNTRLKRDGVGPMESVIAKRKIPGYGTAVAPPGILNPYRAPVAPGSGRISYRAKGGSAYKKGGRVTGIAKRGFGRALMKGKK